MQIVSEDILPKINRHTATKEDLLKAYEQLEQIVLHVLDDNMAEMYNVNSKKLKEVTDSLSLMKMGISDDKDEKAFDRWLRYMEKVKIIAEGQKYLVDNSELSKLISNKKKSYVKRHVKNS